MLKRKQSKKKSTLEGNRVKCGHCHIFLLNRQYHQHKHQFFNALTGTWNVEGDVVQKDVHGSSSSQGGCNLKLLFSCNLQCTVLRLVVTYMWYSRAKTFTATFLQRRQVEAGNICVVIEIVGIFYMRSKNDCIIFVLGFSCLVKIKVKTTNEVPYLFPPQIYLLFLCKHSQWMCLLLKIILVRLQ